MTTKSNGRAQRARIEELAPITGEVMAEFWVAIERGYIDGDVDAPERPPGMMEVPGPP